MFAVGLFSLRRTHLQNGLVPALRVSPCRRSQVRCSIHRQQRTVLGIDRFFRTLSSLRSAGESARPDESTVNRAHSSLCRNAAIHLSSGIVSSARIEGPTILFRSWWSRVLTAVEAHAVNRFAQTLPLRVNCWSKPASRTGVRFQVPSSQCRSGSFAHARLVWGGICPGRLPAYRFPRESGGACSVTQGICVNSW